MTFGERIKLTMESRGVGRRELSKRTGYSEGSISKWCNDEVEPSLSGIIALCKGLKVSADWLVFGRR